MLGISFIFMFGIFLVVRLRLGKVQQSTPLHVITSPSLGCVLIMRALLACCVVISTVFPNVSPNFQLNIALILRSGIPFMAPRVDLQGRRIPIKNKGKNQARNIVLKKDLTLMRTTQYAL